MAKIKKRILDSIVSVSEKAQDNRVNKRRYPFAGRIELTRLLASDGLGVEIGVAGGLFSDAILRYSELKRLYSIDAWADHHDDDEYLTCVRRLRKFGTRSVVMRMLFDDALMHFPDDSMDFVYIDAYAHTGQQDGKLLDDWWPKLKKGGLFSGHDYDDAWPLTVKAVDAFCARQGLKVAVVSPDFDQPFNEKYASWYVWKL